MHVPEISKFVNIAEYAQNLHCKFENDESGDD
jgi:hypothetical protein